MSTTYSEEKLIENVRTHTSLYDVFSVDYKDQNVRKEAWKEIGEVLQMPDKYILYYYIIFPTMHIVAR